MHTNHTPNGTPDSAPDDGPIRLDGAASLGQITEHVQRHGLQSVGGRAIGPTEQIAMQFHDALREHAVATGLADLQRGEVLDWDHLSGRARETTIRSIQTLLDNGVIQQPQPVPTPPERSESNLVNHAKAELRRVGLYDADSSYGGMLAEAVEELVQTFANQGHSGNSAQMVLAIFGKVARWQPLEALTSDPDEWMEVQTGKVWGKVWQSRRNPAAFSTDGGKTWYDVDHRDDIHISAPPKVEPYLEDVEADEQNEDERNG